MLPPQPLLKKAKRPREQTLQRQLRPLATAPEVQRPPQVLPLKWPTLLPLPEEPTRTLAKGSSWTLAKSMAKKVWSSFSATVVLPLSAVWQTARPRVRDPEEAAGQARAPMPPAALPEVDAEARSLAAMGHHHAAKDRRPQGRGDRRGSEP